MRLALEKHTFEVSADLIARRVRSDSISAELFDRRCSDFVGHMSREHAASTLFSQMPSSNENRHFMFLELKSTYSVKVACHYSRSLQDLRSIMTRPDAS